MWNLANVQLGDSLLCLSGSVRATQWYPKAGWAIVEVPSPCRSHVWHFGRVSWTLLLPCSFRSFP